jgi:hypothetical protein
MATDEDQKPLVDVLVRQWRRGRHFVNLFLFMGGLLLGFYFGVLARVADKDGRWYVRLGLEASRPRA